MSTVVETKDQNEKPEISAKSEKSPISEKPDKKTSTEQKETIENTQSTETTERTERTIQNPQPASNCKEVKGYYESSDLCALRNALLKKDKLQLANSGLVVDDNKAAYKAKSMQGNQYWETYIATPLKIEEITGLFDIVSKALARKAPKLQILFPYKIISYNHWVTGQLLIEHNTHENSYKVDLRIHDSTNYYLETDAIKKKLYSFLSKGEECTKYLHTMNPKSKDNDNAAQEYKIISEILSNPKNIAILPKENTKSKILPIQLNTGNVYCGGYSTRLILALMKNPAANLESIDIWDCADNDDKKLRKEDAATVSLYGTREEQRDFGSNSIGIEYLATESYQAKSKQQEESNERACAEILAALHKISREQLKALTNEVNIFNAREKAINKKIQHLLIFCQMALHLSNQNNPARFFYDKEAFEVGQLKFKSNIDLDSVWQRFTTALHELQLQNLSGASKTNDSGITAIIHKSASKSAITSKSEIKSDNPNPPAVSTDQKPMNARAGFKVIFEMNKNQEVKSNAEAKENDLDLPKNNLTTIVIECKLLREKADKRDNQIRDNLTLESLKPENLKQDKLKPGNLNGNAKCDIKIYKVASNGNKSMVYQDVANLDNGLKIFGDDLSLWLDSKGNLHFNECDNNLNLQFNVQSSVYFSNELRTSGYVSIVAKGVVVTSPLLAKQGLICKTNTFKNRSKIHAGVVVMASNSSSMGTMDSMGSTTSIGKNSKNRLDNERGLIVAEGPINIKHMGINNYRGRLASLRGIIHCQGISEFNNQYGHMLAAQDIHIRISEGLRNQHGLIASENGNVEITTGSRGVHCSNEGIIMAGHLASSQAKTNNSKNLLKLLGNGIVTITTPHLSVDETSLIKGAKGTTLISDNMHLDMPMVATHISLTADKILDSAQGIYAYQNATINQRIEKPGKFSFKAPVYCRNILFYTAAELNKNFKFYANELRANLGKWPATPITTVENSVQISLSPTSTTPIDFQTSWKIKGNFEVLAPHLPMTIGTEANPYVEVEANGQLHLSVTSADLINGRFVGQKVTIEATGKQSKENITKLENLAALKKSEFENEKRKKTRVVSRRFFRGQWTSIESIDPKDKMELDNKERVFKNLFEEISKQNAIFAKNGKVLVGKAPIGKESRPCAIVGRGPHGEVILSGTSDFRLQEAEVFAEKNLSLTFPQGENISGRITSQGNAIINMARFLFKISQKEENFPATGVIRHMVRFQQINQHLEKRVTLLSESPELIVNNILTLTGSLSGKGGKILYGDLVGNIPKMEDEIEYQAYLRDNTSNWQMYSAVVVGRTIRGVVSSNSNMQIVEKSFTLSSGALSSALGICMQFDDKLQIGLVGNVKIPSARPWIQSYYLSQFTRSSSFLSINEEPNAPILVQNLLSTLNWNLFPPVTVLNSDGILATNHQNLQLQYCPETVIDSTRRLLMDVFGRGFLSEDLTDPKAILFSLMERAMLLQRKLNSEEVNARSLVLQKKISPGTNPDPQWFKDLEEPILVFEISEYNNRPTLAPRIIFPNSWDNPKLRSHVGGVFTFGDIRISGSDRNKSRFALTAYMDAKGKIKIEQLKNFSLEKNVFTQQHAFYHSTKSRRLLGSKERGGWVTVTERTLQPGAGVSCDHFELANIEQCSLKAPELDIGQQGISIDNVGEIVERAALSSQIEHVAANAKKGRTYIHSTSSIEKYTIHRTQVRSLGPIKIKSKDQEWHSLDLEAKQRVELSSDKMKLLTSVVTQQLPQQHNAKHLCLGTSTAWQQEGHGVRIVSTESTVQINAGELHGVAPEIYGAIDTKIHSDRPSTIEPLVLKSHQMSVTSGMKGLLQYHHSRLEENRESGIEPKLMALENNLEISVAQGDLILIAPFLYAGKQIRLRALQGKVLIKEAVYHNDLTDKQHSISLSFFGSKAIEAALRRDFKLAAKSLLQEFPLLSSIESFLKSKDTADGIGNGMKTLYHAYKAYKAWGESSDLKEFINSQMTLYAKVNYSHSTLKREWTEIAVPWLQARDIIIQAKTIEGRGIQGTAETCRMQAETHISLAAASSKMDENFTSTGHGVGVQTSPVGIVPTLEAEFATSETRAIEYIQCHFNISKQFEMVAGEKISMVGVYVKTLRAIIEAEDLELRTVQNQFQHQQESGSVKASLAPSLEISSSNSHNHSATTKQQTLIEAQENLLVRIRKKITLVGAGLIAPEGEVSAALLEAENLTDFMKHRSFSVSVNALMGTVEPNYESRSEITLQKPTISHGISLNVGKVMGQLNRDSNHRAECIEKSHSHFHVFLPLFDVAKEVSYWKKSKTPQKRANNESNALDYPFEYPYVDLLKAKRELFSDAMPEKMTEDMPDEMPHIDQQVEAKLRQEGAGFIDGDSDFIYSKEGNHGYKDPFSKKEAFLRVSYWAPAPKPLSDYSTYNELNELFEPDYYSNSELFADDLNEKSNLQNIGYSGQNEPKNQFSRKLKEGHSIGLGFLSGFSIEVFKACYDGAAGFIKVLQNSDSRDYPPFFPRPEPITQLEEQLLAERQAQARIIWQAIDQAYSEPIQTVKNIGTNIWHGFKHKIELGEQCIALGYPFKGGMHFGKAAYDPASIVSAALGGIGTAYQIGKFTLKAGNSVYRFSRKAGKAVAPKIKDKALDLLYTVHDKATDIDFLFNFDRWLWRERGSIKIMSENGTPQFLPRYYSWEIHNYKKNPRVVNGVSLEKIRNYHWGDRILQYVINDKMELLIASTDHLYLSKANPVFAAGDVYFEYINGFRTITHIDNRSGCFWPNGKHLNEFVEKAFVKHGYQEAIGKFKYHENYLPYGPTESRLLNAAFNATLKVGKNGFQFARGIAGKTIELTENVMSTISEAIDKVSKSYWSQKGPVIVSTKEGIPLFKHRSFWWEDRDLKHVENLETMSLFDVRTYKKESYGRITPCKYVITREGELIITRSYPKCWDVDLSSYKGEDWDAFFDLTLKNNPNQPLHYEHSHLALGKPVKAAGKFYLERGPKGLSFIERIDNTSVQYMPHGEHLKELVENTFVDNGFSEAGFKFSLKYTTSDEYLSRERYIRQFRKIEGFEERMNKFINNELHKFLGQLDEDYEDPFMKKYVEALFELEMPKSISSKVSSKTTEPKIHFFFKKGDGPSSQDGSDIFKSKKSKKNDEPKGAKDSKKPKPSGPHDKSSGPQDKPKGKQ